MVALLVHNGAAGLSDDDGQHFLGLIDAQTQAVGFAAEQIQLVLNWFEELKARVPTK